MNKSAEKVKLTSFDDLFGTASLDSGERVTTVPLSQLHTFKEHPFRVADDEKMQETVESIKQYGVLMPGIVRPYPAGGYEVIAGHRRWRACELAGLSEMPVIIREMDDDTATVIMVDTNIQREDILPSEKAYAYKMKYEALKHQGSKGKNTAVLVGETAGDSGRTVQRYIRLAELEQNCPKSIFEGYNKETALETYEGITVQFITGNTYLTVQPTEEGYAYIFYDKELHEISGGVHDYIDDSIQEASYEILKKEGMQNEKCVKVDDIEFRKKVIRHSQDLLKSGDVRRTSELGRCEAALNGMSRAEIEYDVLAHTRIILEEMGMENDISLIGARVYGSRSRDGLYNKDSDVDVVVSYRGNMREDVLFNAVNKDGLQIAGIPVDINPISEEKTGTLAEYMEIAEKYLDDKEAEKTEATISFYAAECMEFPVLGEYYDNLTLEEALDVYEKIPAERMNGIKGIGFVLHDGSTYDNAEYELMSAGQVRTDMIDLIPHYRESPLVQKAVTDVKTYLENQMEKETDKNLPENKERQTVDGKNQGERKEISQQQKGGRKESVLQALRERQAKLKAQEQAKQNEKSHTKKKGEQEL